MKSITSIILGLLLSHNALASDKIIPVIIDPIFHGSDKDGVGAFSLEITQADLSGETAITLVDRKQLDALLAEQGLAASGLASEANSIKVGKLLSARYFVTTKGLLSGDNLMIVARVVEVETSLFKNSVIRAEKDEDAASISNKLTAAVKGSIKKLAGQDILPPTPAKKALEIPEGTKLPTIAIYVPEATDGMTTPIDPACEHRLLKGLKANGFTIVELEHSSHAIPFGANGRPQGQAFQKLLKAAKVNRVDILIIGEAFSQRAGTLGKLHSARARVELHAVKVSDQSIVSSDSRYGTALDTAIAIAGKKAIEDASDRIFEPFISGIIAE